MISARAAVQGTARVHVVGATALAAVLVAGLLWAKWLPYAAKTASLIGTRTWSAGSLFTKSGAPGSAPSLSGAWRFAAAYFQSVWPAALVALLVAAGVDALVPRAWLLTALNRPTRFGQALAGGTAALPMLMCTCCTAPVTVGLRKQGTTTAASLAYQLGNPVLNPAVLVFLFLVAPWQLGVVRLVVGVLLVFGAATLLGRWGKDTVPAVAAVAPRPGYLPGRYLRSLTRFALVLVPEYVIVVLAIGWLSGSLSGFSALDARLGLFAVLVCALIGTLLVIPTGGEIPVVLALLTAGAGAGTAGALLITLPALSLPSMVMLGRALSWRVTVAAAGAVAMAGLGAALLLWAFM